MFRSNVTDWLGDDLIMEDNRVGLAEFDVQLYLMDLKAVLIFERV